MDSQTDWPILTTDWEQAAPVPTPDNASVEQTKAWMRDVLRHFEERYGMTSREFYARWLQESIEDTYETTFWASLCRYQQWANT